MGYITHDAVVAVISDYDTATLEAIEEFRSRLTGDVLGVQWSGFLLGPVTGINGYTTYVWAPDGSKEGWETSTTGDAHRAEFIELAQGKRYDDGSGSGAVVHIRFGGDWGSEVGTRIQFTTDPLTATMVANAEAPSTT